MKKAFLSFLFSFPLLAASCASPPGGPLEIGGVYPSLAVSNSSAECGIGAAVPWAGRLWFLTYAPHKPWGSDDKLYELSPDLVLRARPESVGGTPADRMIHAETNQLLLGPYFIDAAGRVRVIPPALMPGRLTAAARHLFDPARKVYIATMEEGLYEVDARTLEVREIFRDANLEGPGADGKGLPGCHGKGAYTAQGRLVHSNNGEYGAWGRKPYRGPAGCLAEWDGKRWKVVVRHPFTEVTGPGGIRGNAKETDPLWALGWDDRSVLLELLDGGKWSSFRLPKASRTYDAAHGWFTEWPRIREAGLGGGNLLANMHGTLFAFPRSFSRASTGGIRPLSTYLKVFADFCRWKDRVVFACDDADRLGPNARLCGRSQSNLWFLEPRELKRLGPPSGSGGPWIRTPVKAGKPSLPYLFAGYPRRMVHVLQDSPGTVTFTFEVDPSGRGRWKEILSLSVPPGGYAFHVFPRAARGEWIRVRTDRDVPRATVFFQYSSSRISTKGEREIFRSLASPGDREPVSLGLLRPQEGRDLSLRFAAWTLEPGGKVRKAGFFRAGPDLRPEPLEDPAAEEVFLEKAAPGKARILVDRASAILLDASGRRFRLPRGPGAYDSLPGNIQFREVRNVVTERGLLNCRGTFYELPEPSSGGAAGIRPICTHNRLITDFCSWRGLLVLAGTRLRSRGDGRFHRSARGGAGLWFGVLDDLWKLGRPRGDGGPWKDTPVRKGEPSDPYLMTGFDRKTLEISHGAGVPVTFTVEVDPTGGGPWVPYARLRVPPHKTLRHHFPEGYQACWARLRADRSCRATALFHYR